jgi:hypothetical protein
MMYIIVANKKLYKAWLHDAVSLSGGIIGANTARMGTAIKGLSLSAVNRSISRQNSTN